VTADLEALLTALYVLIDDYEIISGRRRPGRPKKLSDAELVCLAVAQVLLGARSEHHWLRLCYARLGHLFPYVPHQPGYHKRLKAAAPLLAATIDHLARQSPSWWDQVRLIDATPVPCGASRETVKRSELAGWANYGYCAAHSRWYWGLKLYVITAPDGMPVAWCLASPKLGEREVAAELLAHAAGHQALRPGLTLIGDKGFAGQDFENLVTGEFGLHLIRPDRRDEAPRHGSIGWIRQWIESVNDTLKGQLDLERHGGRTPAGVYTRIAQRLLAMAAAIWHSWATSQPTKRSLTAYDH
jgi:Transposase DDE domain